MIYSLKNSFVILKLMIISFTMANKNVLTIVTFNTLNPKQVIILYNAVKYHNDIET